MNATLPTPDAEAALHSESLCALIQNTINEHKGWIDFAHYMQLALYAPGLGYYSGGAKKFGLSGDFVTAPEISALFAQTLARQVAQVIQAGHRDVLELGAGTGRLALGLLMALAKLKQLPEHYFILEVSAHLRQVQQETLATHLPENLYARVQWLDALPENFSGVVIANEVLDALPVHIIKATEQDTMELGVAYDQNGFHWAERVLTNPHLKKFLADIELPEAYTTEVCLAASGLLSSLCEMMEKGLILLVDYGFPRREYYHPQRSQGTLMCHYRHYAHSDPFFYPGLQDITAHVDFSYVAQTALVNGAKLKGYCSQAQFLINCGITELLSNVSAQDTAAYVPLASQAQKLLSPAEMGELFKVIAFTKGFDEALIGFNRGDRSHTL